MGGRDWGEAAMSQGAPGPQKWEEVRENPPLEMAQRAWSCHSGIAEF